MPFGTVTLNDGTKIPTIAFGTGTSMKTRPGQEVTKYTEQAIENGFSHIDTAEIYHDEQFVGQAIKEEGLKREELYITTKFAGLKEPVRPSLKTSLTKLGIDYTDLYLIHHPMFFQGGMEATWREFEKLKEDGLTRSIGISNFTLPEVKDLVKIAHTKPSVHQIEFSPYNWSTIKDLVAYHDSQGIKTEAFSSLSPLTKYPGGPVDPVVNTIAKRIGGTAAQVIFLWVRSKGAIIVTTSSRKERLQEYLEVADLPKLTDAEISAIEEAGAKGPPNDASPAMKVLRRAVVMSVTALLVWGTWWFFS